MREMEGREVKGSKLLHTKFFLSSSFKLEIYIILSSSPAVKLLLLTYNRAATVTQRSTVLSPLF